jgi:TnpA family transposase
VFRPQVRTNSGMEYAVSIRERAADRRRIGSPVQRLRDTYRATRRLAKTLYLLSYIDDEAYRRRILTQLNRGESRHGVARAIFHGQRGEVRQRYREGQEDQLGALGLVVNVVVLWNTLYMDAALAHLRLELSALF